MIEPLPDCIKLVLLTEELVMQEVFVVRYFHTSFQESDGDAPHTLGAFSTLDKSLEFIDKTYIGVGNEARASTWGLDSWEYDHNTGMVHCASEQDAPHHRPLSYFEVEKLPFNS